MAQGTFLFIGDFYIAEFDWQNRIPHFEVINYGGQDETVEEVLRRIPRIEKVAPVPDIILIMTGIQNVINKDYTFVDQIRRMVIRLINRYPETEIIVNSLPNIHTDFLVEEAILHLNKSIATMARETGSCYLDNFEILKEKKAKIFKKDGIHLTAKAYDKWARSFLEFVAFLLEDD